MLCLHNTTGFSRPVDQYLPQVPCDWCQISALSPSTQTRNGGGQGPMEQLCYVFASCQSHPIYDTILVASGYR